MLAKDEKTLRAVRAIKAAIILAKTAEGSGGVLKEEDEIKMLQNWLSKGKTHCLSANNKTVKTLLLKRRKKLK